MRIYLETPLRPVMPRTPIVIPDERDDLRSPQPLPPADVEALKRRLLAAMVGEVNRMLSVWVSEREAVNVYREGLQLGLALAGDPNSRIVVRSRLDTVEACAAALA